MAGYFAVSRKSALRRWSSRCLMRVLIEFASMVTSARDLVMSFSS